MSTYPKHKRGASTRSSRPRKRSFHGNQFTKSKSSKRSKGEESVSAKKLSSATSENVIVDSQKTDERRASRQKRCSALETKEARKEELQVKKEPCEEACPSSAGIAD